MSFRVLVQLKKGSDVQGPWHDSREGAESEITKIRDVIGAGDIMRAQSGVPDLPWLAAQGHNIVSASVQESGGGQSLA